MSSMIYLDSNIFVSAIINPPTDQQASICKKILMKIISNEISAATSLLTWDEVIYVIKKTLGREIAIVEGKKFLIFPNLKFLKVDEDIIFQSQNLISKYQLNPRDAIHAATAIANNINEIISDDADFDQIKELKRIKLEKFK